MFFPTLFNIAKSYRGNADEVSSFKAISSAAWNEKEGYNEWEYNIFIEIYFIILWSNGQKNKNSKSSVSSTCRELSSLNISRLVDLELCPFLGLPCVCLSRNVMEFSTDVYIMEKFTYKTDTLVWIKHIIGFLFWWTFRKIILICLKSYDIHTFHFKMPRTYKKSWMSSQIRDLSRRIKYF